MPIAVIMPKFEMTQETGTVGAWLKAEGDFVRKGEPILEIETDKVSMEVEAPADGTLVAIAAGPRDVVPVGQPIAYLVRAGETWPAAASEPPPRPAPASEPPPTLTPAPTPAPLPGREDKADAPPPHPVIASPVAARMAADLGIDLSAVAGTGSNGQVTRKDIESYLSDAGTAPGQPAGTATGSDAEGAAHVRAVPAARRLARELGVDLRQVRGTGPTRRIQSTDVRDFAARTAGTAAAAPPAVLPVSAAAPTAPSALAEADPDIHGGWLTGCAPHDPVDQYSPHHRRTHGGQCARGAAVHSFRRCGYDTSIGRRGGSESWRSHRQTTSHLDGAADPGLRVGVDRAS
jgi:pyruvate dehydrogenase E2 component (dihydrolipoamide acetyltransferase)